jgi:hypothetical protein
MMHSVNVILLHQTEQKYHTENNLMSLITKPGPAETCNENPRVLLLSVTTDRVMKQSVQVPYATPLSCFTLSIRHSQNHQRKIAVSEEAV